MKRQRVSAAAMLRAVRDTEGIRVDLPGASNGAICAGKCGGTYLDCIKSRGYSSYENRNELKDLDLRYKSWVQATKAGFRGLNHFKFNAFGGF